MVPYTTRTSQAEATSWKGFENKCVVYRKLDPQTLGEAESLMKAIDRLQLNSEEELFQIDQISNLRK